MKNFQFSTLSFRFITSQMRLQTGPKKNYFSRMIEICRMCTDYPDDELNKFSDAELLQLFNAIIEEKNKTKKKN